MTYKLRRHSDGKLIETSSAIEANDLVANGVAQRVVESKSAVKAAPVKTTEKADESK